MTAARLRSAFWTSPLVHGSHCLRTSRPIWPLFLGTPCRPASSDVLVRAAGGSRHGVVDRLRESRKPHAGSRDCAGARDRHPLFPRRRTMETSAPVADGECIVVDLRRLFWSGAGVRDDGRAAGGGTAVYVA